MRDGQEGRKLRLHFCPTCGTTLYWFADALPEWIGIAVGTFADPSFAKPKLSVWERTRHSWVAFDHVLDHFPEGAVSAILPTRLTYRSYDAPTG